MCVRERICLCEIEGESVLESSRNRKLKKRELEKEREIAKEMIWYELKKEKEGR